MRLSHDNDHLDGMLNVCQALDNAIWAVRRNYHNIQLLLGGCCI